MTDENDLFLLQTALDTHGAAALDAASAWVELASGDVLDSHAGRLHTADGPRLAAYVRGNERLLESINDEFYDEDEDPDEAVQIDLDRASEWVLEAYGTHNNWAVRVWQLRDCETVAVLVADNNDDHRELDVILF